MSNESLYLIGTVHSDLDGEKRLGTLLDRLSPSVIALEFHKDRESIGPTKKFSEEEWGKIDDLIDGSELDLDENQREVLKESSKILSECGGYEYRSSKEYVERNPDSKLEYIDISVYENGKEQFDQGVEKGMGIMFKQLVQTPELKDVFLEMWSSGVEDYLEYIRVGTQEIYRSSEEMSQLVKTLGSSENLEEMRGFLPPDAIQALEQIFNPQRDENMGERVRGLYDGDNKLVSIVGLGHLTGLSSRLEDLDPTIVTLDKYDSI